MIGLIVNPRSGNDVRRVVASAGSSTLEDKISIVRRIARGAISCGVTRFMTNREPHRIVRRATETIGGIEVSYADSAIDNTEADSTRAAEMMRAAGCGAVVVLGGDGTNRAVAKGWGDVPLLPLSTGTNNAFPVWCEPTVAGMAAALVASGDVVLARVSRAAKLVHVAFHIAPANRADGTSPGWQARAYSTDEPDIALIDAVAVDDPFVGSLELFNPATVHLAMLTRADPASIGFCGVGGLLESVTARDDAALVVRFADPAKAPERLLAPTAPGHIATLGIAEVARIGLGERWEVVGPMVLAFDGERKRRLLPGDRAVLWVQRDGPRVIDVAAVMADAVASRRFVQTGP